MPNEWTECQRHEDRDTKVPCTSAAVHERCKSQVLQCLNIELIHRGTEMNGTQDLNKWYTMEVYQMNKIQMPTSRESWYESTRVCESVVITRNVNMLKALKITPMERN